MKNLFRIFSVLCVSVLLFSSGIAIAQDLTIGNHTLISKQRVGRTYYNYTYQADVTNSGSDVRNVTANLTSNSSHTTVVDRDLSFGDVGSGSTVTSNDTFIIKQDRRYPLDWADLVWDIQFSAIPTEPVEFDEGNDIPELTEFVPPTGGTLTVTDPISPIYGVVVDFPAGALPQSTEVTIGHNDGSLVPNSGTYSGTNIFIEVPGIREFSQPVEITVPFDQPNSIPIPYYITGDGSIRPCQLVKVDRVNKTFTFQTFHASLFTWIWDLFTSESDTLVDTGFEPNEDGFQIVNRGTVYSRPGHCMGMSSYSLWYYMNRRTEGIFYTRFYDVIGLDSTGYSIRGQDVIATRATISILQQWNSYIPAVAREQALSDEERFGSICNIIENTFNPVMLISVNYNTRLTTIKIPEM